MAVPTSKRYQHQDFPKYVFKRKGGKIIDMLIHGPAQFESAVAEGWVESPADCDKPVPEVAGEMSGVNIDELRAALADAQAKLAEAVEENDTLKSQAEELNNQLASAAERESALIEELAGMSDKDGTSKAKAAKSGK